MPLTGVTDLSVITDRLVQIVNDAVIAAGLGFPVGVTGGHPEAVRSEAGCQLSIYLFRVHADEHTRNSPLVGAQLRPQRPFGLVLYYLVTAASRQAYVQEQQVITIAIRSLHDTPLLRIPGFLEEYSLTMDNLSTEHLGTLWQAASTPFRLSTVYRLAVAFLQPAQTAPAPAPPPSAFTLTVDPSVLPFAESGQTLGTFSRLEFTTLEGTQVQSLTPATVAPGQEFILYGAGLNRAGPPGEAATDGVFLNNADGTNEQDVTAWRVPEAGRHTSSKLVLQLPPAVGTVPANSPAPGTYLIAAGGGTFRTNGVPVSIGAAITGVAVPPVLTAAGGVYTVNGAGFEPGTTEVFFDTVALAEGPAPLQAGQFEVQAGGTQMQFRAPMVLPAGRYSLRVRVRKVESPPSWWIEV